MLEPPVLIAKAGVSGEPSLSQGRLGTGEG